MDPEDAFLRLGSSVALEQDVAQPRWPQEAEGDAARQDKLTGEAIRQVRSANLRVARERRLSQQYKKRCALELGSSVEKRELQVADAMATAAFTSGSFLKVAGRPPASAALCPVERTSRRYSLLVASELWSQTAD